MMDVYEWNKVKMSAIIIGTLLVIAFALIGVVVLSLNLYNLLSSLTLVQIIAAILVCVFAIYLSMIVIGVTCHLAVWLLDRFGV